MTTAADSPNDGIGNPAPTGRKLMNMNNDDDDAPTGIAGVSRWALRVASATVQIDERTGMRALLGYPVRQRARERLLRALKAIDVDVSGVPGPFVTAKADLDDTEKETR